MVRPTPRRSIGSPQTWLFRVGVNLASCRILAFPREPRRDKNLVQKTAEPSLQTSQEVTPHPAACELYSQFAAAKFIGVTLQRTPSIKTAVSKDTTFRVPSLNCPRRPVRQDQPSWTASSPTKENQQACHLHPCEVALGLRPQSSNRLRMPVSPFVVAYVSGTTR